MQLSKWMLKAAVQKAISYLPYRNRINLWFQRYITRGIALDDQQLAWKLEHARDHWRYYRQFGTQPEPVCLELGTGWYPVVPISLYLCGAEAIHTIDLNAHLSRDGLRTTLDRLIIWQQAGQLAAHLPDILPERWDHLMHWHSRLENSSLKEALAAFHIHAQVADARRLPFPDHRFDLICSNNTFEHIYPDVLEDILREFRRVLRPDGGVMSHFIDLSDHFAHFDPQINIYNFLRFSRRQWQWIDNAIQPQNRWRWRQYQELYESLALPITAQEVRSGDLDQLCRVPVHDEFSDFQPAELAISHGYLVSKI